uniref:Uncharacterized protein n=1 Tax=viral metagenome TaxID=1070528 RepID=A0A6C0JLJ4_9ZZZZ
MAVVVTKADTTNIKENKQKELDKLKSLEDGIIKNIKKSGQNNKSILLSMLINYVMCYNDYDISIAELKKNKGEGFEKYTRLYLLQLLNYYKINETLDDKSVVFSQLKLMLLTFFHTKISPIISVVNGSIRRIQTGEQRNKPPIVAPIPVPAVGAGGPPPVGPPGVPVPAPTPAPAPTPQVGPAPVGTGGPQPPAVPPAVPIKPPPAEGENPPPAEGEKPAVPIKPPPAEGEKPAAPLAPEAPTPEGKGGKGGKGAPTPEGKGGKGGPTPEGKGGKGGPPQNPTPSRNAIRGVGTGGIGTGVIPLAPGILGVELDTERRGGHKSLTDLSKSISSNFKQSP